MSAAVVVEAVSKRFGGNVAVDSVSLTLSRGEVHGLIGPNGSGKTTFMNVLSGYYTIDSGSILLDGEDISRLTVKDRAQRGLARTFQTPKLLPELSVLDNTMLGGWPSARAGFLETALSLPRALEDERRIRQAAMNALQGVGLGHFAHRRAETLEHTNQRFIEIARALTMAPHFLMLDEPAGGLSAPEIGKLGDIIRAIARAGIGVLIVEHHTDFVFRICDNVTALNLGKVIAHGLPDNVSCDAEVIRVYLGA